MAASNLPAQVMAGSTWIAQYQKNKWPVVICDANTVPPAFLQTRSGSHALPAVLLGRHKYAWVDQESLQEWDPNRDYLDGLDPFEEREVQDSDTPEVKMEKQRRLAFRQDVTFLKDHKYRHNYMTNQSEARKADSERRNNKTWSSRPRNSGYQPSTPQRSSGAGSGKRLFAAGQDSQADHRQLRTIAKHLKRTKDTENDSDDCIIVAQPSPPRRTIMAKTSRRRRPSTPDESPIAIKSSRRNGRSAIVIDSDLETEREPEPVAVKAKSQSKARPSAAEKPAPAIKPSRKSRRSATIINSDSETEREQEVVSAKTHSSRSKALPIPKKDEPADPKQQEQVLIIFSHPSTPTSTLQIPLTSLQTCKFLLDRLGSSPRYNSQIIPLDQDLAAQSLHPTFEEMHRLLPYFRTADLGPKFIYDPKIHPHPFFARLGVTLKAQHAELLGQAFVTASKIGYEELQGHILAKLKGMYPLPEGALLGMAKLLSEMGSPTMQAGVELGRWVIEHMVESYPRLVTHYAKELKELFDRNKELASAVYGRLHTGAKEEKSGLQDESIPA